MKVVLFFQVAEEKKKELQITELSSDLENTKKSLSDTKLALDTKAAEFTQVCWLDHLTSVSL